MPPERHPDWAGFPFDRRGRIIPSIRRWEKESVAQDGRLRYQTASVREAPAPAASASSASRDEGRQGRGVANQVLSLLEAFDAQSPELGIADLARRLDLPRSTVHRLLQVLVQRGYVVQGPTNRKYRLSWKLYTIGSHVLRQTNLRDAFRPVAEVLAERLREAVHLTILVNDDPVHIDKIESPGDLYIHTYIGQKLPIHAVASGKAIWAFLPESARERLLGLPHPRFTSVTVTDPESLRRVLATIRQQGVAVNRSEWREEAAGAAAPIFNHLGMVVGSIGCSGSTTRLTNQRLQEIAPIIRDAAEAVSRQLGWQGDIAS